MKKMFLVGFRYKYYCQGMEWTSESVLVYADSYEEAVNKIILSRRYDSACNFENLTIE